jgi:hypothetical protein
MYVVEAGELVKYARDSLLIRLLTELDLAHIEVADASYCILLVHNCWRLPLSLGQNNINKVLGRWNWRDLLEVVHHHFQASLLETNWSARVQKIMRFHNVRDKSGCLFFFSKFGLQIQASIHTPERPCFSSFHSPVQNQGVKEAEQAEGAPVPTVKEERVFSFRGFLVR